MVGASRRKNQRERRRETPDRMAAAQASRAAATADVAAAGSAATAARRLRRPGAPPPAIPRRRTRPPPPATAARTASQPQDPPGPGGAAARRLGHRVGAALLDGLIIGVPLVAVVHRVDAALGRPDRAPRPDLLPAPDDARGQTNGQTLGKQIVGIRVVQESSEPYHLRPGRPPGVRDQVPAVRLVGGFFLAIPRCSTTSGRSGTTQNRALHDMLASTELSRPSEHGCASWSSTTARCSAI